MSEFLMTLGGVWPWILAIVVLLMLFVVILLSGLVKRSGTAPSVTQPPPEPEKKEQKEVRGLAAVRQIGGSSLSASFARAVAFLKANVAGRDYRYQIPWFLMMGDTNAGKSTILANTGVPLTFEGAAAQDPLEWRFFDRGIVIGVPGDCLADNAGGSDLRDWNRIMRQLQRYRSRRPIDGILLVVPATDLIGPRALDEPALGRAATRVADRLVQAQKLLGLTFPVYVLISKCDEISGFGEFARELPARLRDGMFGWSSPYHLDAAFSPDWVSEAVDHTVRELEILANEILVERNGDGHPEEVFLLPEEFAEFRDPLKVYLSRLFRETAYREGFHFRGLYFTGDMTAPVPSEADLLPMPEPSPLELAIREAQPKPDEPSSSRPARPLVLAFLKDLFESKIFAEQGIARPLAGVYLLRNQRVIAIQATAAITAGVLTVGTWIGYQRLDAERNKLHPMLTAIVGMPRTPDRERHNLLLTMAQAGDVRFRAIFLPSSLLASTHSDITRVMTSACNQWVMSTLRTSLERRAKQLIDREPRAAEDAAAEDEEIVLFADVEATAEYQELEKFVSALRVLKENVDSYENLRQPGRIEDLDRIRKLVQYLYNSTVPEVEQNGHFARAMEEATGAPFNISPADRETASAVMKGMIDELFDRWFGNSLILNDVTELKDKIASLEQGRAAGYQDLKTVLDAMKQTDSNLTSPRFRWVSNPRLDLAGSFRRILRDPIEVQQNPWLSPDTLDYARRMGEEHLNRLRNSLSSQRTGMTGSLVDVRETVQLSSGARALEMALENAMNLRFMSMVPSRTIRVTLDPATRLIWRNEPLQEAARLYEIYTRFVDEGLRDAPERLRSSLGRVAMERMKLNAEDLVAQAQEFTPRPLTRDRASGEEGTLLEVNSFRNAVEPLIQLATRFRQLGAVDVYNKILRIMTLQSLNTLQTLDARLTEEDPYAAKGRNFGWWNGQGALSLAAFEARNPTELQEYLTAQRERIKFIEQQAEPFVRFLEVWFPTRGEGQSRVIAKWQRIIADFRQYDGKRPGASVSSLEEFITTEMDKITPENACKASAAARGRDQDQDFFLQIRGNLRNAVVDRCEELGAASVFDAYNEIADLFNRSLAGKFPFANTGPLDRIENEASPDAVLEFYKLLDKSGKAARGTLQQNVRFSGGTAQAAIAFLDQMENLRPFVVAQTAEGEKEPPFTLDFLPKFRINQGGEVAGNQIIEWTMQVGGQIWRLGEPDHPGRWRLGNPIRLSLRFAKDSLDFPVRETGHPNIRVRGERNVFFEYTNRWSLLAFLRRHEAPASELARSGDLKPYTLKLRLKTDRDPRWQGDDSPRGQAIVYMNMRLMPPGGKNAAVVPPFPVKAPALERPSNQ